MTEVDAANGLGVGAGPYISRSLRALDIRLYYTNDGILPNHFALFRPGWQHLFSVFFAFSSFSEVNVAFFLTRIVFVLFMVGYRTKLFHALSLLCISSLNARNLLIENGGILVEVWWVRSKSPQPGQERGQALPPDRLLSFGTITDSLAIPWLRVRPASGPLSGAEPVPAQLPAKVSP